MSELTRREFAGIAAAGLAARRSLRRQSSANLPESSSGKQQIPLKIGHRAASMKMVGDFDVFKVARQIPGLSGVELQIAHGDPNLRDLDTVRRYKKEACRWDIRIPSLAGVWDRGVSLSSPSAGLDLFQSIRAAELLGASVILVAFFRDNAPDMDAETSYGPVVEMLQKVASKGADAGVTLGLENSLSPEDNKKLVDLVAHPRVQVYYDLHNMAYYGHGEQAVPGVTLLGKERICQVHVKNQDRPLGEPGMVDWKEALAALNSIEYDGWFVFESQHPDREHLKRVTSQNISFLQEICRMPFG